MRNNSDFDSPGITDWFKEGEPTTGTDGSVMTMAMQAMANIIERHGQPHLANAMRKEIEMGDKQAKAEMGRLQEMLKKSMERIGKLRGALAVIASELEPDPGTTVERAKDAIAHDDSMRDRP
jgi:hypothetical protein